MFKRLKLAVVACILMSPVFATAVVYGESGTSGSGSTPQTTTGSSTSGSTTTTPKADDTTTETPAQKAERAARIQHEKEVQKVKLATTDKVKLEGKCQAAQGKTTTVSDRLKTSETARNDVHKNLVAKLTSLDEKLKAKGIDTTQLEADIATLNKDISTFNTDLATYKQSVTDLKALDCKTDPEGFKAALLTARTNLEKVRTDATTIQSYLTDTIKPLLKTLRDKVDQPSTTTGQ